MTDTPSYTPNERAAERTRRAIQHHGGPTTGMGGEIPFLAQHFYDQAMTTPRMMGRIAHGEVDPTSKEAIGAALGTAAGQIGGGMQFAPRGAAGVGGGYLKQPPRPLLPPGGGHLTPYPGARVGEMPSLEGLPNVERYTPPPAPANSAHVLPEPLSTTERTWRNYTKNMTPDEAMRSEAVWGGAHILAEKEGVSEAEGFAQLMNDYYGNKGMNQFMTPEVARRFMGQERGIHAAPDPAVPAAVGAGVAGAAAYAPRDERQSQEPQ
jgi:hypothetical protein